MNCQTSIPGPRGDRNPWPDNGNAKLPNRPPHLRTVLLIAIAAWGAIGLLSIVGAFVLQWWRSR